MALGGLAIVLASAAVPAAHAQGVCDFNLDTDPAVLTPDTFRFCVDEANTDGTIDTVNSQLAGGSTVDLSDHGSVGVNSSMTIDGDNPYTLFSGTSTVLSLSGGHMLTIRPNVTVETENNSNYAIIVGDAGNAVNLEGQIVTSGDFSVGIIATAGNNAIDVSGSIATAGWLAQGIYVSGGHNAVDVSGSIHTEGDEADGVFALDGDNTIDVSGSIKTEGELAHGVWAPNSNNNINVSGWIDTGGERAFGIRAEGGNNDINVSGSIETSGDNAHSIYATGGNTEINVSGSITTAGDDAYGILAEGGNNAIDVSGSIITLGFASRGIVAEGGNNEINVSGSIETEGDSARGIWAFGGDNTIDVSGAIGTEGFEAHGIQAEGGNNDIGVSGTIETTGDRAHGILAEDGHTAIDVSGSINTAGNDGADGIRAIGDSNTIDISGTIETTGFANGIVAIGDSNTIDLSGSIETTGSSGASGIATVGNNNNISVSGSITTVGFASRGIVAEGADSTIHLSGSIETSGIEAHGIEAVHGNITVIVSGSISATGAGADAIRFDLGGGNRLELQPGYAITGNVVGFGDDTLTLGGEGDDSFDSDLIGTQYTGFTEFEKRGGSTWTLLGDGGRDWTVFDGTFLVAGSAGFIDVTGGTLGGTGTVAGFIARSGSVISPGASIGTLNVTGDGEFEAGSVYLVEIDADGNSDLLAVDGVVVISSEAALHLVPAAGLYGLGDTWLILTAGGGFVGLFGIVEGLDLAFLKPRLVVEGDEMHVELVLKTEPDDPTDLDALGTLFHTAAVTANQSATGYAIGASGIGDPLFDLVVGYTVGQARHAFDVLSGEIYATLAADLRRSARRFVAAVLRGAGGGAGTGEASSDRDLAGRDLWVRSWGSWDRQSGDGDGARATTDRFGAAAGIEAEVAPGVRLGAAGGYRNDSLTVAERWSDADVDTLDIAGYGRVHLERLRLTGGLAAAFHRIEATRDILIPGLAVQARSSPNATSISAFAEAAYAVEVGPAVLEPFAAVTWGRTRLHSFAERGAGIAGLISTGATASAAETALGLRVSADFAAGGIVLRPQAAVAWEHAFSDLTGRATHRFAGSPLFTVHGPARPRDRLALAGGLEAELSEALTAHLGYEASLASGSQSHGVTGGIRLGF